MADTNITYKIVKKGEVLSTSENGWTLEANIVSWNDKQAKIDIRSWSPDHEKCGKGITLTRVEYNALKASDLQIKETENE